MKMEYKPRQIRRGTNSQRIALGGLAAGEWGFETDLLDIYIGTAGGDELISDHSARDFLNGQDQAVKTTSSPAFNKTYLGDTLFIGITTYPTNEYDGLRIYTKNITDIVGRGMKIESFYSGVYASTGSDVVATAQGSNDQDHVCAGQYTPIVNLPGKTITAVYGNKLEALLVDGTIIDFYHLYLGYINITAGTVTRKWSLYSINADPSWMGGRLGLGAAATGGYFVPNANYQLDVRSDFLTGAYGFYNGQICCFSRTAHAIDVGGVLALGGESGLPSTPYPFAFIGGLKRVAGTYEGYMVFHTTSGGAGGEADGGNYERARLLYEGLSLTTGRVYMVNMVPVLGPRVVDARVNDAINAAAWDATTAGVLESLRDAAITHGWIKAA
jgi:hypothetical protein